MAPAKAAAKAGGGGQPPQPQPQPRPPSSNNTKAAKKLEKKLATLTAINGMLKQENEALRGELAQAQAPRSQTEHDIQEVGSRRSHPRPGAAD